MQNSAIAKRTSVESIRELPLDPGGVVQQALPFHCAPSRPPNLGCPACTGERGFLGLWIRAVGKAFAVGVCGYIEHASFARFGQVLNRSGAIVLVGDDCSAFLAPTVLELGGDSLHRGLVLATASSHGRVPRSTYSLSLSSLLLRGGIWVEGEGGDTGVLGLRDDFLLGIVGRDLALGVISGLNGPLGLEFARLCSRHVARNGDGPADLRSVWGVNWRGSAVRKASRARVLGG